MLANHDKKREKLNFNLTEYVHVVTEMSTPKGKDYAC